jgi:hypothetical protein
MGGRCRSWRRSRPTNAETRASWNLFTHHRNHVSEVLCHLARGEADRIGVFGAGNCNDVDLVRLSRSYSQIDLIDWDRDALGYALRSQQVSSLAINVHGGIDLTGLAGLIPEWDRPTFIQAEMVASWEARLYEARPRLPMRFEVTTSIGVLSQLIDGLISAIGQSHPYFVHFLKALRRQHLRLLLEHTKPEGSVFLGLDVLSSDTCPELLTCADSDLEAVLIAAINACNFFTGLNPVVVRHALMTEPQLAPLVAGVSIGKAWLWNLGARSYAVVPFIIGRSSRAIRSDGTDMP